MQGHRGARGLRPQNSLAGFACALEIGVTSLECDVVLAADGAVVLSHERSLPYPSAGPDSTPTPIGRLTLDQLRRIQVDRVYPPRPEDVPVFRGEPDQRIATLGEVLALLELFGASEVRLDVEIKSARHSDPRWDAGHVVERVTADISAHGALPRCSLRSFDLQVQREALTRCPQLPRALLVGTHADAVPAELALDVQTTPEEVVALGREVRAAALAPSRSMTTRELVDLAHADGLPVVPWTVNDPAQLRAMLDLGVDGVCTDRPDLVRATLAAEGVALPARHRAPSWLGYGWTAWPEEVVPTGAP